MNVIIICIALIAIATLVIVGPFVTIFVLNQLFSTDIPFTFYNWLSMMWLHLIFSGSAIANSAKK